LFDILKSLTKILQDDTQTATKATVFGEAVVIYHKYGNHITRQKSTAGMVEGAGSEPTAQA